MLERGRHKPIPGEAEQAARFVRNYTDIQSETRPFDRFRFAPTAADRQRIARLRQGEVDTVRVLCLRVEFVEDTTPLTTGNGKMDTLGFLHPDSGLFYDPPHTKLYFERQMEGVRNYFLAQSMGRLRVETTVMPAGEKDAYQMPRDMVFYGDTTSWLAVEIGLVRLMRDAFKVADRQDTGIDFADYDEFIIFHAGSGLQADFGLRRDSPYDLLAGEIPAGALEAYLGQPYISVDEGRTRIEQATVLPEMMRQDTMYNDDINLLGMTGLAGTLVHEFAHLLGAYDLYDVTGVTMGVGAWSLMGYGGWLGDYGAGAPPGVIPGFLDAYHRVYLGMIEPLVVNVPRDSLPVYAAAVDTAMFAARSDTTTPTIVKIPITTDEYFLIENRQVDVRALDTIVVDVEDGVLIGIDNNEYDFFQPGSGILIWHVDESVIADYGPYNAINYDYTRKGVDLEEGDGIQDYDVPYWQTWAPDYEIYGYKFDAFSTYGVNDRFTAETEPNTDGYSGRSFLSVTLSGETDSTDRLKDTIMSVRIAWDLYQRGFPVGVGGGSAYTAAAVADLDSDDTLELVCGSVTGSIRAWRHDGRLFRSFSLGDSSLGSVAVGDVFGDERPEIVGATVGGRVLVFPGVGGLPRSVQAGDMIAVTPVLADLDADGKKEIIVGATDMKLHVWQAAGDSLEPLAGFPLDLGVEVRAPVAVTDTMAGRIVLLTGDGQLLLVNPDGSVVDGFPLRLTSVAFYSTVQPIVADFDRDGVKEIAAICGGEFDNRLRIVEQDGSIAGESRDLIRQPYEGLPAAVDVDGDGYPDVLAASVNELFAFGRNGRLIGNYPFREDSLYEVSELAGNWIIYYDTYFVYGSSPLAADFDGDGDLDLAIGSPHYGVLIRDARTGRPLSYSPLMAPASVSSVPLVADLDQDGDIELAVGSDDGIFYVWDLPGPADRVAWGCAQHDPCRTGLLPDTELPIRPDPDDGLVTGFFVYPNPAGLRAAVRYRLNRQADSANVTLLDMAGDIILEEIEAPVLVAADNEPELDLSTVDPGLYVVRLVVHQDQERTVQFTKLAVVR